MKQKVVKKSLKANFFHKKPFESSKRKRHRSGELSLLADFLANRISAAGISHVVKSPSRLRRAVWLVIILLIAAAMGCMTYRVLQEYLAYPTILRSKNTAVKELEFPAVTVCALNLIPKIFAKEADIYYLEEMRQLLDSLPTYNLSNEEKTQCLKDPLCDWSWFEDRCSCEKNPCDTLYCYPDANKTDEYCACSMLLCQWNWTSDACFVYNGTAGSICICKTSFEYPQFTSQENLTDSCLDSHCETMEPIKAKQLPKDFLEALSMLETTPQITELLKKLRSSVTDDVKDVERFFVPSVSVVDNYGSPADSFILSCSYGPERCEHLLTLYSPTYGKCYMFNYVGEENEKKSDVKVAKQAGREHGLQLYMQARTKDAVALLTKQLGVRIVIHDPRSIPIASENGIDVRPGDMVSMSVEYIEINRLGPPWGECASDNESLPSNYSADPYIQTHCEKHCVSLEFYRRCKCYHPMFLASTVIPQRGVICPTNDSDEKDACVFSVMMDNAAGKIKCSCPPPCREKHYHTTTSSSRLNPDFFQLVKKAKSLTIKNGTATVIHPDYEFSLMGVQIYYNSFFVTYVNETAIYSWESLIANIGGNMGLFLGLSIVTLLEIAEFLAEMITRCISQKGTAKIRDKSIVRTF